MSQVLEQIPFHPTTRRGPQWHGPCPVHRSSRPSSRSFSVNVELDRYYCHSCGSQGHQLELWAAVRQLSLYAAAIDLCQHCGRSVPWSE